ncbi:hypothetical protein GCM10020219_083920 [Nonomuraea dietziae]
MTAAAGLVLATPAAATDRGPGAPGIGDSYFPNHGNGGYDAKHYSLNLDYQPGADLLRGRARILATATQHLTRFNLDFLLKVDSVKVDGRSATFARTGLHELEITPARALTRGKPFLVEVSYADTPSKAPVPDETGGFQPWIATADGALALGQPQVAWWWFPSNDHPLDKATYDITVSVPKGTQAITNGIKVKERTSGEKTTSTWVMDKPMATYLATLFIGQLEVRTGQSNGLPVVTAYSKDLGQYEAAAKESIEQTPQIVEWLAGSFGRYPFRSMGGSVTSALPGFALETQTQPVYDPRFFRAGPPTPTWSCTRTPTSGSATVSRSRAGSTSGSTRASRPTPSGCGRRSWARARRRRSPTTSTACGRLRTSSGRSSRATRARPTCSTTPPTTGARWRCRR